MIDELCSLAELPHLTYFLIMPNFSITHFGIIFKQACQQLKYTRSLTAIKGPLYQQVKSQIYLLGTPTLRLRLHAAYVCASKCVLMQIGVQICTRYTSV